MSPVAYHIEEYLAVGSSEREERAEIIDRIF
jgi:hypothetical protein